MAIKVKLREWFPTSFRFEDSIELIKYKLIEKVRIYVLGRTTESSISEPLLLLIETRSIRFTFNCNMSVLFSFSSRFRPIE